MKDEKMMILSMLEEGKITSQEAIKLLEALDETDAFSETKEDTASNKPFIDIDKTKEIFSDIEKNIKQQGKKVESLSTDLGGKITGLVNNIIDNINDKGSSINFNGPTETLTSKIEKDLDHIENPTIELESINGNINVKKWDEEKLSIDITCKYKNKDYDKEDEFYNFYEEGDIFKFIPLQQSNVMISLDVYLPDKYYEKINLETNNGKIQVKDFRLDNITCNTSNGSISIMDIDSKSVELSTKNGKINLNNITSPIINALSTNARINAKDIHSKNLIISTINGRIIFQNISSEIISGTTSNGSIEVNNVNSNKIKLITSNDKIICKDIYSENLDKLFLTTSNSVIDVELKDLTKPSYFDLETSIGGISLEIPDLIYKVNKQIQLGTRKIIAHSVDISKDENHFMLEASTSNGSINIR